MMAAARHKQIAQRLARAFAFGRHIPPAKIARRIALGLQRKFRGAVGSIVVEAAPPARSARPPLPLFPARKGMRTQNGDGQAFHFIGRTFWGRLAAPKRGALALIASAT